LLPLYFGPGDNQVEGKLNFIMSCTAYAFSRQILSVADREFPAQELQDDLDGQLMDGVASRLHAFAADRFRYLLGYTVSRIGNRKCIFRLWIKFCAVRLYIVSRPQQSGRNS
jgi:hypothetical protein